MGGPLVLAARMECLRMVSLQLISADFMIYLDTEIENQETNSQWENLLVTIKLRLLDEQGKKYVIALQPHFTSYLPWCGRAWS